MGNLRFPLVALRATRLPLPLLFHPRDWPPANAELRAAQTRCRSKHKRRELRYRLTYASRKPPFAARHLNPAGTQVRPATATRLKYIVGDTCGPSSTAPDFL